ncbi:hypothetical protein GQ53DRAFT_758237 [Thozetella sp. PMI_491]|nr:hypothetical protein GQ53DRAFT_758237 [Thozetella sp. PMI_491]
MAKAMALFAQHMFPTKTREITLLHIIVRYFGQMNENTISTAHGRYEIKVERRRLTLCRGSGRVLSGSETTFSNSSGDVEHAVDVVDKFSQFDVQLRHHRIDYPVDPGFRCPWRSIAHFIVACDVSASETIWKQFTKPVIHLVYQESSQDLKALGISE